MSAPDFTMPQGKVGPRSTWKKISVHGQELYVPRQISWMGGRWRITVRWRHTDIVANDVMKSLEDAYHLLDLRLKNECGLDNFPASNRTKQIDTGVVGVRLAINDPRYLIVDVHQMINEKSRNVRVASIKLNGLTQKRLDHELIIATGVRRYYMQLVESGSVVANPVLPHHTPEQFRPFAPVRQVTVEEVLDYASRKGLQA